MGEGTDGSAQGAGQGQGSEGSGTDGSGGTQGGAGGEGGSGSGEEEFDRDRAMRTITAQREAEAKLKTQLAEANQKLKEAEDAKLTDAERQAARLLELEKQVESLGGEVGKARSDSVLLAAAVDAKSSKPEAVLRLADMTDAKRDDAGVLTKASAKDLVEKVRKGYPELFGKGVVSGDGGARGGAPGESMNDKLRHAAGR